METITYDFLQSQVKSLQFRNQAFINGRYQAALSGKTFDCINPATGELLTKIAAGETKDIDQAVKAARHSFTTGHWSKADPTYRKKVLLSLAELVEKHTIEFAMLETLNMGKPISNSLDDVAAAVNCLRWYAEAIDKIYDQIAPTPTHILALITREPVGVVGAVIPWNFPLYIACAKLAPALAVGNSLILKPAEQSPLTAIYLAELAHQAGIPEGVFNVVPGFGETAGQALGLHNDVDVISFTGSTEVGKFFLKYSAESNMKRIFLECGGKSPNIVLMDCGDIDKVALDSITGAFFNQGEVCCAPSRLLVAEAIREQVMQKLLLHSQQFQPGDPLDPTTKMGPIVNQEQLQRVLNYISLGTKEGATLTLGGKRIKENTGGYFVEPTIFANVDNAMTIAREEIFGPVLSVLSFTDELQAIKIANDTHYGLAASVWTQNINKAHSVAKALRAGVVSVNCINGGDITTPFGGYKQSGIGRESSLHGIDPFVEVKTTWIELR